MRGAGSYATALRAMEHLADAGMRRLQDLGGHHPPQRRLSSTRSRRSPTATAPSCASRACGPPGGAPTCGTSFIPPPPSSALLYDWLMARGERVLTGDSFFHLGGYGAALPGLNLCGAGRVVCLIDPVGDVYACPFAIHDAFLAGNVRDRRRLRPTCGASPTLFADAALSRRRAAPARRAACSTPAGAAAWRPSSSPGCRSTVPIPSACWDTARPLLAQARPAAIPAPAADHSRPAHPRRRAARVR